MKTALLACGLCLALGLAGCDGTVVVVHAPPPPPQPPPPEVLPEVPPEVVVVDESGTLAEIDAAAKLSFDSDQTEALTRIAQRRGLDQRSQIRLVDATLANIRFDSSQRQILLALVGNPEFCSAAKARILGQLDRLKFESTKRDILAAIQDRGELPV